MAPKTDQAELMLRYGATATEWLQRWDDYRIVWSVEMGGLGPGYEQCIQIMAAEFLRHLIGSDYNIADWDNKELWARDRALMDEFAHNDCEDVKRLGPSGAQVGAAWILALCLWRRGPVAALSDPVIKDRKIQVCKKFP